MKCCELKSVFSYCKSVGLSILNTCGGTLFCPPGRGLPSREAQVLKDLRLRVCPDFGRDLRYGIWTGPTRRCHSVYFQSAQKGVPQL